MPVFRNREGLPFTAASQCAVDAYDALVDGYARFSLDLPQYLGAMFRADADMPMAHCARGYLHLLAGRRELVAGAQAECDWLQHTVALTPWERLHRDALRLWLRGDMAAARQTWEDTLTRWPLDFLALKLAQLGHFYAGEAQQMRDAGNRAAVHWQASSPLWGFVMGCQAFGYEECGDYRRAEALGRTAADLNPDDLWAVHAVAHCMEMQDKPVEGIVWLDACLAGKPNGTLLTHLLWHRALMQITAGRAKQALDDYDAGLYGNSLEYLDVCNDASLLLRLELAGHAPEHRWAELAERARTRSTDALLPFCDMHYALALASHESNSEQSDNSALQALLAGMRTRSTLNTSDAAVLVAVGIALADGIVAWRRGDFALAAARLYETRRRVVQLGGSNAQRDLFELILMDAAEKAGCHAELNSLHAERLGRLPESAMRRQALRNAIQRTARSSPLEESGQA